MVLLVSHLSGKFPLDCVKIVIFENVKRWIEEFLLENQRWLLEHLP